jgi:Protein of unknown function (DUF1416)
LSAEGCGAPAGGVTISKGIDDEAIIEGHVTSDGTAVTTGYARLLGTGDEFVAEVPLGDEGQFRFFAAPGTWKLRVLAPGGRTATEDVAATLGNITKIDLTV